MRVVSFIDPPEREVIEKILQHFGLCQASSQRAPPDMNGLVLDLDATYADTSIGSSEQAGESRDLTCVDIDTFLATF